MALAFSLWLRLAGWGLGEGGGHGTGRPPENSFFCMQKKLRTQVFCKQGFALAFSLWPLAFEAYLDSPAGGMEVRIFLACKNMRTQFFCKPGFGLWPLAFEALTRQQAGWRYAFCLHAKQCVRSFFSKAGFALTLAFGLWLACPCPCACPLALPAGGMG